MCGRLPRDTLIAAHQPDVPSAAISSNIAAFFRCVLPGLKGEWLDEGRRVHLTLAGIGNVALCMPYVRAVSVLVIVRQVWGQTIDYREGPACLRGGMARQIPADRLCGPQHSSSVSKMRSSGRFGQSVAMLYSGQHCWQRSF